MLSHPTMEEPGHSHDQIKAKPKLTSVKSSGLGVGTCPWRFWVFIAVIKGHDQKQLGKKGVYFTSHFQKTIYH